MCGRFTYLYTWKQLHKLLSLDRWPPDELGPRYNLAPTQFAPVVRVGADGVREGVMMKWGLVPHWADDAAIGNRLINARSETVREKPAFRAAFKSRRCIIACSGFYEWRQAPGGGKKQPYWIGREDRQPLYFAGLWERWDKGGAPLETFTILTTDANSLVAPIHDRMPVALPEALHERWLDPTNTDLDALQAMLRPADPTGMETTPVSSRVNSPRFDDPSVLAPAPPESPDAPTGQEPSGLWPERP